MWHDAGASRAVYLGTALAGVWRPGLGSAQTWFIEEFTIPSSLTLPDEGDVGVRISLRHAVDGPAFEIAADDTIDRDEAGMRAAVPEQSPTQENLAAAQTRCVEEISVAAFYERLTACGLDLGPAFQGIERLSGHRRGSGSSRWQLRLYKIREGAFFFPPLLDACLQVFGAAVPDPLLSDGAGILLVGVERFQLVRPPAGTCVWSHAVHTR